jgi:MOSC domain-containing protein YiiM
MAFLLEATIAEGGDVVIPVGVPEVHDPDVTRGFDAAVRWLESKVGLVVAAAQTIGTDAAPGWAARVEIGESAPERFGDAAWILRHAVHDLTHHLSDAGRGLHRLGAGAPTQLGTVAQLARSGGGVPKAPVAEVEVGHRGVLGDRQADRRNHGRPFQALCLWSTEVIDALRAEGHPIRPGAAGENVTVQGIDWTTVRTGVRLRIGEVLCEVSVFALPCAKNAKWFADRDFRRMLHERHPGWSRAYAWVLEPGTIREGDAVEVEPA